MQRQPTSLFLVAEAYRQELLADAGRIRPVPSWKLNQRTPRLASIRITIGRALIDVGHRLVATKPVTPAHAVS